VGASSAALRSRRPRRRGARRADPRRRVEHLGAKEALLADASGAFFTTPHFDGHPSVLVRLGELSPEDLEEVAVEAWLARAPKRLADDYLRDGS
jgi:hypothetical protein